LGLRQLQKLGLNGLNSCLLKEFWEMVKKYFFMTMKD